MYQNNGDLLMFGEKGETTIARNVIAPQALRIAKILARKYEEVKLFDETYEAFFLCEFNKEPNLNTYWDEDFEMVQLKYGIIKEIPKKEEYTNLRDEKWNNYWGNYDQCGIHISY